MVRCVDVRWCLKEWHAFKAQLTLKGRSFWKINESIEFVEDLMFDKPGLRSSRAPEVSVSRVHLG